MSGRVQVPSSKNASLPLMCLSLLTNKKSTLKAVPQVADIKSLSALLAHLGAQVTWGEGFEIQFENLKSHRAPYDLVRKMRASVMVLGPMLARYGRAEVSLPGGCAIGERPIDIHLDGLKALGAKIEIENGYVIAEANRLRGTEFELKFPSVTGTLNLIMAACLAEGATRLENVAREPEIINVGEALISMGANISGLGSRSITIEGVSELGALDWVCPPDRIQLITYLAAAVITRGEVICEPYQKGSMDAVIEVFRQMGGEVLEFENSISLKAPQLIHPVDIETQPFPGFPTDAQAQLMACLCLADKSAGSSHIRETIFENRFQHASELRRMGADIEIKGNLARVKGVNKLSGAAVMASDLRASASLVLAGLAAENTTQVLRVYHLDRGYQNLEEKLSAMGANIKREPQR